MMNERFSKGEVVYWADTKRNQVQEGIVLNDDGRSVYLEVRIYGTDRRFYFRSAAEAKQKLIEHKLEQRKKFEDGNNLIQMLFDRWFDGDQGDGQDEIDVIVVKELLKERYGIDLE